MGDREFTSFARIYIGIKVNPKDAFHVQCELEHLKSFGIRAGVMSLGVLDFSLNYRNIPSGYHLTLIKDDTEVIGGPTESILMLYHDSKRLPITPTSNLLDYRFIHWKDKFRGGVVDLSQTTPNYIDDLSLQDFGVFMKACDLGYLDRFPKVANILHNERYNKWITAD